MSDSRQKLTVAGARALLVERAESLLMKTRPWEGRGGGRSGGSSSNVSERQAVMRERDREQLREELRALRIAVAEAASLAEIANYIRYRVGFLGPGNPWRARDFGERLVEQLENLPKLVGEAEGAPDVLELARLFVGFLNRAYHYQYAIAGRERIRSARTNAGRRGDRDASGAKPRSAEAREKRSSDSDRSGAGDKRERGKRPPRRSRRAKGSRKEPESRPVAEPVSGAAREGSPPEDQSRPDEGAQAVTVNPERSDPGQQSGESST